MSLSEESALARRQARFGWWTLLTFLTLGIVIEALHAFKVPWLLDVQNETRRFMWRLAHAHGILASAMGTRNLGTAGTWAIIAGTAIYCIVLRMG